MKTINVRDLQRRFKEVSEQIQQGESLIVLKNTKPIFRIEPITKNTDKEVFMKAIKDIQFEDNENLSKDADNIVYEK